MIVDARHDYGKAPMLIIGILFFMFGFVTWLNGSLIPFLQIACELNHMQAYLVTMAFYIAYTVMALPLSFILRRTGYRKGMLLGLVVMVVGALLFIPAAMSRVYTVFLLALFVLGSGLTMLQTASNPYIVLIGPSETAAVRISVMGILNKAAGVLAPLVFTALVLGDIGQFGEAQLAAMGPEERNMALSELSARLVFPYLLMALMLVALAIFLRLVNLPEPEQDPAGEGHGESILQHPQLLLGAITLFFYVGAEVIAGDTIALFGKEQGVDNFTQLTSYTMVFMVIGYCLGMAAIPRFVSQERVLQLSAVLGIVLTLLLVTAAGDDEVIWEALFAWTGLPSLPDSVLYVALFGLANAMVWPAIWPLALEGLSPNMVATGSALLIMGIAGGALLPLVYGALAVSTLGAQGAYWIMLPCYGVILFYALHGHKYRRKGHEQ